MVYSLFHVCFPSIVLMFVSLHTSQVYFIFPSSVHVASFIVTPESHLCPVAFLIVIESSLIALHTLQ